MMIFLAAAIASAQPGPVAPIPFVQCPQSEAAELAICKALQAQKGGDSSGAAQQFEAAAAAFQAGDARRDRALTAAGNMWIAAGEPGKAALAIDRALSGKGLQGEQRGQALLDRARAAEAQGDLKTARARLDEAAAIIPGDSFLWYFSAALAIREGNVAAARSAIGRALTLAPSDPAILFEVGHVAQLAGDDPQARQSWSEAARLDPAGPIGKAAKGAIALLPPVPADGDARPPEKQRP